MSRLILASLVALLGLSTGAAFATNDFLAQQAATQAAFLGGSSQLALRAEGGSGGTAGGNDNNGSAPGGQSTGGSTGGRESGGVSGNGGAGSGSNDNNGSRPGGQSTNGSNGGRESGGVTGNGGNGGSSGRPGGVGNNGNTNSPGNTPSGNGNQDPRGQNPSNPSNTSNAPSAADKAAQARAAEQRAAERTQNYAKDLQNYNRDRQSSPADIKAAKDAAVSRLSTTRSISPSVPANTPTTPSKAGSYFSDISSYQGPVNVPTQNCGTGCNGTQPRDMSDPDYQNSNQYNQDKALRDAIDQAKTPQVGRGATPVGIDAKGYTDPGAPGKTISGPGKSDPEATPSGLTPPGKTDLGVGPKPTGALADITGVVRDVLDTIAGIGTTPPVPNQIAEKTTVPVTGTLDLGEVKVNITAERNIQTGELTSPAGLGPEAARIEAINTPDGTYSVPTTKGTTVNVQVKNGKLTGITGTEKQPSISVSVVVDRTPPKTPQETPKPQQSEKDPKTTNAIAAQKAAEQASKVAAAKEQAQKDEAARRQTESNARIAADQTAANKASQQAEASRRQAESDARIAAEKSAANKASQQAEASRRQAESDARIAADKAATDKATAAANEASRKAEASRRQAESDARIAADRAAEQAAANKASQIAEAARRQEESNARIAADNAAKAAAEKATAAANEASRKAEASRRQAESDARIAAEKAAEQKAAEQRVEQQQQQPQKIAQGPAQNPNPRTNPPRTGEGGDGGGSRTTPNQNQTQQPNQQPDTGSGGGNSQTDTPNDDQGNGQTDNSNNTDGEGTTGGDGQGNGGDTVNPNDDGAGGGGTPQPKPNLTERIAQLTQPKIGSFFQMLFQLDEPSENVEVAPPMTREEYEAGPKLEGAFTAIGQPDEETESGEEEGEGGEEAEPPAERDPRPLYRDNMAVGADDPIWDKVHPDLKRDKDRILDEGKIRTGALIAADAVYRHAEKKGVPMHVAVEGGADDHSTNHLKGGIGESLDIKPGTRDEHENTWSKYKADPVEYAKIATAAIQSLDDGKARIGVPLNRTNGLHVQDTGNEGLNKPTMSWVYGRDTIGAGRSGKRGGFRDQLRTGVIRDQYAKRVAALYAPSIQRVPPKVAVADLPKTIKEIPKAIEADAKVEDKVAATEEKPSKIDLSQFKLPDYVSKVKLGGGGTAKTGQPDAKAPEAKQPETSQPAKPQPAPKTVTKKVTETVPSQLKKELDAIEADLREKKIDLGTAVEAAQAAAKKAGTEVVIDQIEELRKNPNVDVVYETTMTLGEMKPHMTAEQLAQIPTIFGKQVIPNSMKFDIGIAVPKETLTAEVTREVTETVSVDTPVQTLIDQPVPATDEEATEPETPRTGLTAVAEPPPPGATPETTWKYTVTDPNGDTIAHVEVQPDGSMNLEGGVIGQPVTTEPDGPQNVTVGGVPKTITVKNGRVVSIKDAPVVSPESEPETEADEPADIPAPENPIKKAVKVVTTTVKSIFNFIFGDREEGGEGREIFTQPGMGGTGTSTR